MAKSITLNIDQTGFILSGEPKLRGGTLLTDAERATPLATYTVLSYITASKKWVPFTDVDAIDGTHRPRGIYVGPEIAAADIAEGDVTLENDSIIVGGNFVYDKNKLVFENSLDLDDTISGVNFAELKTQLDQLVSDYNEHTHADPSSGDTGVPNALTEVAFDDAERMDETLEQALNEALNAYSGDVVNVDGFENS
jgi:hypothetical protein